jgi:hypothetical protein
LYKFNYLLISKFEIQYLPKSKYNPLKKIYTLFTNKSMSQQIFGWVSLYTIFVVISAINQMQHQTEWYIALVKGFFWPVEFIEFLLGVN